MKLWNISTNSDGKQMTWDHLHIVALITTYWQSLCIFKLDANYLQTLVNLSESDCTQYVFEYR